MLRIPRQTSAACSLFRDLRGAERIATALNKDREERYQTERPLSIEKLRKKRELEPRRHKSGGPPPRRRIRAVPVRKSETRGTAATLTTTKETEGASARGGRHGAGDAGVAILRSASQPISPVQRGGGRDDKDSSPLRIRETRPGRVFDDRQAGIGGAMEQSPLTYFPEERIGRRCVMARAG